MKRTENFTAVSWKRGTKSMLRTRDPPIFARSLVLYLAHQSIFSFKYYFFLKVLQVNLISKSSILGSWFGGQWGWDSQNPLGVSPVISSGYSVCFICLVFSKFGVILEKIPMPMPRLYWKKIPMPIAQVWQAGWWIAGARRLAHHLWIYAFCWDRTWSGAIGLYHERWWRMG